MARKLKNNQEIADYLKRVMDDAEHHGPNVVGAIEPLAALVRTRLDLARDGVEVYERNGKMARTCWIRLRGKMYIFTYNYGDLKIDLRDRSIQGSTKYRFHNQTTLAELSAEIMKL